MWRELLKLMFARSGADHPVVLGRDAVFRHERQPAVRLHTEQSLLRHDDRDHFDMTFTIQ